MWVYQETSILPALPSASSAAEESSKTVSPETSVPLSEAGTETAIPAEPLPVVEVPDTPAVSVLKRAPLHPDRNGILLASAYLFGTFLAGILCALCSTGELEILNDYLNCWRTSFAAETTAEVAALFRTELLTTSGALTILLLLGLSAIGSLPIFCFIMLYGAGAGMLSFQLLANVKLSTFLVYCAASGIPTALAAGCLCLFGMAALQVSGKIQKFSFGKAVHSVGAWSLLGQFARTLFLLLPICGIAAGTLYLCGQLKVL